MQQPFIDSHEYVNERFEHHTVPQFVVTGTEFNGCTFKKCHFSMCTFKNCTFTDCVFDGCDVSVINVMNCRFIGVQFISSKVTGVNWTMVAVTGPVRWFSNVSFTNCDISYANFTGFNLEKIVITSCIAKETDFTEVNLTKAILKDTDFENARFVSANLTQANLVGARNYVIDMVTTKVKGLQVSWPDCLSLLSCQGITIDGFTTK
jgi:fluoroquinolone resistance protein